MVINSKRNAIHQTDHQRIIIAPATKLHRTVKRNVKKSLPVRKLLELERNVPVNANSNEQQDALVASNNSLSKSLLESMNRLFGGGSSIASNDKLRNGYNLDTLSTHSNESENSLNTSNNTSSNLASSNQQSITCDECNKSMDLNQFIIHLKDCKPQLTSGQNAQLLNLIIAAAAQQQQNEQTSRQEEEEDNKSIENNLDDSIESENHKLNGNLKESPSKIGKESLSNQNTPERSESRQSTTSSTNDNNENSSNRATPQLNGLSPKDEPTQQQQKKPGSVLSALEQLIEKSFDSKSKKSTNNQGILQRLGIDEEVNPPWAQLTNSPPSTAAATNASAILPNTGTFFPWSP